MSVLKGFLLTWICYWGLQLILPISPSGDSVVGALLVQLTFVLGVAIAFTITEHFSPGLSRQSTWQPSVGLIYIALTLSVLGTAALVYDKVLVQGIDYSAGLAYAREQWRQLGEARDGAVSSFASVLGYLLGASYTVAVVLFPWVKCRGRVKFLAGGLAIVLALINTMLTGGRSTLILALLFYMVSRSLAGPSASTGGAVSQRSKWLLAGMIGLSGCYFLFIFLERAEATGISIAEYSHGVIVYLGLQPSEWLSNLRPDSLLTGMIYLLVMGVAYFCHSFATTVSIVDFGPYHNSAVVVFGAVLGMASKLKLLAPVDTDWFLAGLFPSFPGALYLQGGWFLLSVAAVVLGLLSAVAYSWFRTWPSLLSLGALTAFGCVLLASPILFVGDVMMFPFIMPQFVLVWLIWTCLGGNRKVKADAPPAA